MAQQDPAASWKHQIFPSEVASANGNATQWVQCALSCCHLWYGKARYDMESVRVCLCACVLFRNCLLPPDHTEQDGKSPWPCVTGLVTSGAGDPWAPPLVCLLSVPLSLMVWILMDWSGFPALEGWADEEKEKEGTQMTAPVRSTNFLSLEVSQSRYWI